MSNTEFGDARILIVDDQQPNVTLLERLLERTYRNVTSTTDSSRVVELVATACPDLLLLDLQMPEPNGFQIMDMLAPWTRGKTRLPILVLTADESSETKRRALSAGANDFLTKPFDPTEAVLRVRNLLETRALQLELQRQNELLDQRVRERTRDLEEARLEILEHLALAAEYRDDATNEHAQRVGRTSALVADRLGLSEETAELVLRAAPLHDIGKIGIPDAILLKQGKLTPDEFELMKSHSVLGAQILRGSRSPILQVAEEIALTHHERWNGTGYPAGLAGEEIPTTGRITALADVFDAITHERPYKEASPLDAALAEIRLLSGTHFDRHIAQIFLELDHAALVQPL